MLLREQLTSIIAASLVLISFSSASSAQVISTFEDAITETVIENPEVKATWYEFEAAREQQRVASGNYRPKLDLNGEIGRERAETPRSPYDSYDRDSANLTLTQMLFDGFETKHEVARLGYAKLSKFYEIKQASERSALEAAQSYLDVLRYQSLVGLAKENYVNHKKIHSDIKQRADAGISRRVDLEQASGRLALSESNLLTEVTNLHDVTARFQRLTGRLPAEKLERVILPTEFISDTKQASLNRAYITSPVINSAIENLRATQSEIKVANAAHMPKFDLRLRKQLDNNTDGILGRYDEEAVELVMTYNLYNGGSDSARKRQLYQQMNAARELRQKACRDVRQQLSIAYNDIVSLEEQVGYLDRNRRSIASARIAYRKQFDIGQRTLLDLLDTENEYFEVQRAYKNANQDLLLAQVRTLSSMGVLLDALGVAGRETEALEYIDIARPHDADIGGRCPDGAPEAIRINKDALFAQVLAEANYDPNAPITVDIVDISAGALAVAAIDDPVTVNARVAFAYKSTALNDENIAGLNDAAALLSQYPNSNVIVAGYTDSVAPQAYNLKLSQKRADAVKNALITDYGIDENRLTAIGYGEENPIADNASDEGRSQNRRVELILDVEQADSDDDSDIFVDELQSDSTFESIDEAMAEESVEFVNDEYTEEIILGTAEVEESVEDASTEAMEYEAGGEMTLETVVDQDISADQVADVVFESAPDESDLNVDNASDEKDIQFEYLDQ